MYIHMHVQVHVCTGFEAWNIKSLGKKQDFCEQVLLAPLETHQEPMTWAKAPWEGLTLTPDCSSTEN